MPPKDLEGALYEVFRHYVEETKGDVVYIWPAKLVRLIERQLYFRRGRRGTIPGSVLMMSKRVILRVAQELGFAVETVEKGKKKIFVISKASA